MGRVYIAAVIASGIAVVLHSLVTLWGSPLPQQWFVLAGLTLLSGSFTIRVPTIPARLSVSETFVFAAVLLFGPAAATIIVVLDTLVISLWLRAKSRRTERVLFNMAAPAVAIWIASQLFFLLAQIEPLSQSPQYILSLLLPLFALALSYFLLNSALIAVAVALEKDSSAIIVWRQNFVWLSLNYFSGASVAALLLPYLQAPDSQFIRVVGVLLPLLLISYLTFKTTLGRVEDANGHLRQLNRLYLSTIETLAMAIDAKDQITHGHIRRVQTHAVRLAKAMGVTDEVQIQAIEAAALLHDMGKLAVPEYILNKPGPLTASEFDKMKLHASVGADILSAIDFPYPVVPIVRHHHESWDGSGYPQGLSGSDIPLGARILSVVDCFDALTSDRPYRAKLSDDDAIEILRSRRGKMYDPLVVDTFIALHPELSQIDAETVTSDFGVEFNPPADRVARNIKNQHRLARLNEISASRAETMGLLELAQELASSVDGSSVASAGMRQLRRFIPSCTSAIFLRHQAAEELLLMMAQGPHEELLSRLRVKMGQRLTGWVGANRQTIRNSDAILDLGDLVSTPVALSALSTPIVFRDTLVGVLTIYTDGRNAFNDDDERIAKAVANQIAGPLYATTSAVVSSASSNAISTGSGSGSAVVYVHAVLGSGSRSAKDSLEGALINAIRRTVRPTDIVRLPSNCEVVILMNGVTREAATAAAARVTALIDRWRSGAGARHRPRVRTTVAIAPEDGSTEEALLLVAQMRAVQAHERPETVERRQSIH